MKPVPFILIAGCLVAGPLTAQNVGIGTPVPLKKLHISSTTDTA